MARQRTSNTQLLLQRQGAGARAHTHTKNLLSFSSDFFSFTHTHTHIQSNSVFPEWCNTMKGSWLSWRLGGVWRTGFTRCVCVCRCVWWSAKGTLKLATHYHGEMKGESSPLYLPPSHALPLLSFLFLSLGLGPKQIYEVKKKKWGEKTKTGRMRNNSTN